MSADEARDARQVILDELEAIDDWQPGPEITALRVWVALTRAELLLPCAATWGGMGAHDGAPHYCRQPAGHRWRHTCDAPGCRSWRAAP